uniref:Uncharacterized protein n=1 Tax=Chromera velia CCMP2878 TaxID=1169474 RepID=A0A0G4FUC3_9ALVE|eukprot:Cvel_18660.t1-p1 / transcript=Cvel_18660.t1 / gene=Cvel_18660 / organism=Chromera_velia_CCMP2878 / gene_product=Lecithin-cholesterol acyltransferase-like 1, putative / transcript_product=Lecithin-cholesterol acyltransferase-like 1, putative / location=Cvel_scaffold1560:495-3530(+) / protein_length=388 / sequence_SO=supercontig / SO=protein_coding / is_pseudo=false
MGTIEDSVKANGGKGAVLVAHSMGAVYVQYLLNVKASPAWKKANVRAVISVNGALGGSFNAIGNFLSGSEKLIALDLWGIHRSLADPLVLRDAYRSFGSGFTLLPSKELFDQKAPVVRMCVGSNREGRQVEDSVREAQSGEGPEGQGGGEAEGRLEREERERRATSLEREALERGVDPFDDSAEAQAVRERIVLERTGESLSSVITRVGEDSGGSFSSSSSSAEDLSVPFRRRGGSAKERAAPENLTENRHFCEEKGGQWKEWSLKDWSELLPEDLRNRARKGGGEDTEAYSRKDPGVPVVCVSSRLTEAETPNGFVYLDGDIDQAPLFEYTDGDGVVPLVSQRLCDSWKSTRVSRSFEGATHMGILSHRPFLDFLRETVEALDAGRI